MAPGREKPSRSQVKGGTQATSGGTPASGCRKRPPAAPSTESCPAGHLHARCPETQPWPLFRGESVPGGRHWCCGFGTARRLVSCKRDSKHRGSREAGERSGRRKFEQSCGRLFVCFSLFPLYPLKIET